MRQASYTDTAGRRWAVLLPEGAPDGDASLGVPLGPPSLAGLGLPEEREVRLHNQLFARRLFTAADARKRRLDIFAALQAALSVDVQRIVQLYLTPDLETERPSEDGESPPRARMRRRKERSHG